MKCCFHLRQHPNRQQRMAPQIKKTVIRRDLFETQQITPDSGKFRFDLIGSRCRLASGRLSTRASRHCCRFQRISIKFAIGCSWKLIQYDDLRRQHIAGELSLKMLL